jgi:hypothetical protein
MVNVLVKIMEDFFSTPMYGECRSRGELGYLWLLDWQRATCSIPIVQCGLELRRLFPQMLVWQTRCGPGFEVFQVYGCKREEDESLNPTCVLLVQRSLKVKYPINLLE